MNYIHIRKKIIMFRFAYIIFYNFILRGISALYRYFSYAILRIIVTIVLGAKSREHYRVS